jgi:hypothetical protein
LLVIDETDQALPLRSVSGGQTSAFAGFEVAYVDSTGEEARGPLADVAALPLEMATSVRRFGVVSGTHDYSGLYYAATLGRSRRIRVWLELDQAMALDFAPDIVGFAAQPFWLFWLFWQDTDRVRSHAPDFFARTTDGGGVVIDCRDVLDDRHGSGGRDAVKGDVQPPGGLAIGRPSHVRVRDDPAIGRQPACRRFHRDVGGPAAVAQ